MGEKYIARAFDSCVKANKFAFTLPQNKNRL